MNRDYKLTKTGRPRSVYTMRCEWRNGNVFTYRSDETLVKLTADGYKNIGELDALLLVFQMRKQNISDCRIYDNRLPHNEDLLLHYSGMLGVVLINNLPKKYKL